MADLSASPNIRETEVTISPSIGFADSVTSISKPKDFNKSAPNISSL
jgi:hypothetical protein